MTMNKQTVWLVTMLTLMVVLSAYYIVTGPVQPVQKVTKKDDKGNNIDVNIRSVDEPVATQKKDLSIKANNDYFVGYQLQRSELRSKMTEQYMKVLTNPSASKQELKEAQDKIDDLMKIDKRETVLEEMIRKEGFRDAVVVTNHPHIDVIVQTNDLTKKQVVKLISMVKQQLNVSPLNVSVAYRP
jgi:stage III sporulation protein AH